MNLAKLTLLFAAAPAVAFAQVNAGEQKPEATAPFETTKVTELKLPWRIAFLPDGRMLITEKVGGLWIVSQSGEKVEVKGIPAVAYGGQGGMLGVYLSPKYKTDKQVYLTYSEPGEYGSGLALARGKLVMGKGTASLEGVKVLWRDTPTGKGGQFGAAVAFGKDGYLYLSVGDRQRFWPAQDPNTEVGKIIRLTLDGKPAPGNPMEGQTGAPTRPLIDPARDTELGKAAPVVSTLTLEGPNLAPAETWATGVRTPYGMAFGPDGRLWEVEHGPRGGDELNLIEKGKNYGWPLVSYGVNYNGTPIPSHDTRPDLEKPKIYWVPVIAPGNIAFYKGKMFPEWNGSALIPGLGSKSLTRIVFDGKGGATAAERFAVGFRARDAAVAPDGAIWLLEDANPGGVYRAAKK